MFVTHVRVGSTSCTLGVRSRCNLAGIAANAVVCSCLSLQHRFVLRFHVHRVLCGVPNIGAAVTALVRSGDWHRALELFQARAKAKGHGLSTRAGSPPSEKLRQRGNVVKWWMQRC